MGAGHWETTDRREFVVRVHAMREAGATFQSIVDAFRAAQVPTGSGRGRWAIPAVRGLLAAQVVAPDRAAATA